MDAPPTQSGGEGAWIDLDLADPSRIRGAIERSPRSHAVIDLSGVDGACVQAGATSGARSWLRERFAEEASAGDKPLDAGGRPRADLRGVAVRARLIPCGSSVEADLRWLDLARARRPADVQVASERLIGLGVVAEQGVLRVRSVDALAPGSRAERGLDALDLLGPCRSRADAERLAAALGVIAGVSGHASVLADGSSARVAHDDAVRTSLTITPQALDDREAALRDAMTEAVAAHEFERAAELRERVELLESIDVTTRRVFAPLRAFRWLVVTPSLLKKHVRAFVITPSAFVVLPDRPAAAVDATLVLEADGVSNVGDADTPDLPRMAVAARHLFKRVRRVTWFRLGGAITEAELVEAAAAAGGVRL